MESAGRPVAGPMRKAVCSIAIGDAHNELLSLAEPALRQWAGRHGYDVHLIRNQRASTRPPSWEKVPLLRRLLPSYDAVMWIDADALIVDPEGDIAEEVTEGKHLYLVEHRFDNFYVPNVGVMLILNHPSMHKLLEELWGRFEFIGHPWWENAALLQLLGYPVPPTRRGTDSPFLEHTQFIDHSWNSTQVDSASSPRIIHCTGMPLDRSREILTSVAAELPFRPPEKWWEGAEAGSLADPSGSGAGAVALDDVISAAYRAILGRDADESGFRHARLTLDAGLSLQEFFDNLIGSEEFQNGHSMRLPSEADRPAAGPSLPGPGAPATHPGAPSAHK